MAAWCLRRMLILARHRPCAKLAAVDRPRFRSGKKLSPVAARSPSGGRDIHFRSDHIATGSVSNALRRTTQSVLVMPRYCSGAVHIVPRRVPHVSGAVHIVLRCCQLWPSALHLLVFPITYESEPVPARLFAVRFLKSENLPVDLRHLPDSQISVGEPPTFKKP